MRLVTFAASGAQRVGALVDNDRRIVDFAAAERAGRILLFAACRR